MQAFDWLIFDSKMEPVDWLFSFYDSVNRCLAQELNFPAKCKFYK